MLKRFLTRRTTWENEKQKNEIDISHLFQECFIRIRREMRQIVGNIHTWTEKWKGTKKRETDNRELK